jgi:hypothetical protein
MALVHMGDGERVRKAEKERQRKRVRKAERERERVRKAVTKAEKESKKGSKKGRDTYSTTPRNGNRTNGNHLDQSLSSPQKNGN